jgi:hypothetical protein
MGVDQQGYQWIDDAVALNIIRRFNVSCERVTIPSSSIDTKRMANQSRFGWSKLKQSRVDEYALDMMAGEPFPCLVVIRARDGKYNILGGNHRFAATEIAGITNIDAYLLTVSDISILDALTRMLNRPLGEPTTMEENVMTALEWADTWKKSLAVTAQTFKLSYDTLSRRKRQLERIGLLESLGVRRTDELTKDVLERLGPITNHTVLKRIVPHIIRKKMKTADAAILIDEVVRQPDEQSMLEVVIREETKGALPAIPDKKVHMSASDRNRATLYRHVRNTYLHLQKYDTRATMGLTDADKHDQVLQMAEANASLIARMRER